jgi:hypothetical protein
LTNEIGSGDRQQESAPQFSKSGEGSFAGLFLPVRARSITTACEDDQVVAAECALLFLTGSKNALGLIVLLGGLPLFGFFFAVNSSLHSYLIVSYANEDGVSLDVGFTINPAIK